MPNSGYPVKILYCNKNFLTSNQKILAFWVVSYEGFDFSIQCSSEKILLEDQSDRYNPFLGARYFKKGPMY